MTARHSAPLDPPSADGSSLSPAAVTPVVIRFGRLGDTILLQPLLRKLQQRYGKPCHVLALGDWPQVLFSAQPEVDGFIPLRSQYGSLLFSPPRWRVAMALRKFRDSPIYVCEPEPRASTKVRPLLALAGIPKEHCEFIQPMTMRENEHWIDWLLRFGSQTPAAFRASHPETVPEERTEIAPQLKVTAAERNDRDAWLRMQGMLGRPLVLLQPANKRTMRWNGVRHADDDEKSWPAQRWGELARAISYRLPQAQILFCGSAAEAGYIESLLAATKTHSLRIDTAVLPLGRLKALLEIAHSMVSVDTGPAHLAAAVGCPLVVLFGGRFPSMWAPRSGHGSAVTVIGGLPETSRVDEIDATSVISAWRTLPLRAGSPAAAELSAD
ncbi:heptosyltransferase-2/heptosyltransferase-3 [Rhodanobacter sp. ANJX3]|uniref:glycosyltransferase family 9 protein n=1 Tax=unclassified Rhodanobacter TaxID=2621553 RepID=UPI0015C82628|nr:MULTISPECIES: glycosyltransferase family 9 protein [unclassified Rhodanobacter]MBB5359368.1 heptosyltransferase-2/heptosyltransferase-3 [Rhodanobacter sp. ANJX3]NYE29879.1 heptosyltransferase-2/heptosyltransferase-3 [Rhodanobacter sp. K2T2]